MTSWGGMLYPVLPQAESTLGNTKLTIGSLSKRKKNLHVFFPVESIGIISFLKLQNFC